MYAKPVGFDSHSFCSLLLPNEAPPESWAFPKCSVQPKHFHCTLPVSNSPLQALALPASRLDDGSRRLPLRHLLVSST